MHYSVKYKSIIASIFYLVTLVILGVIKNDLIQTFLPIVFFAISLIYIFERDFSLIRILSPLSLLFLYVCISFSLGAYAFSKDLVLQENDLISFKNFKYLREISYYYLISLYLVNLLDHLIFPDFHKIINSFRESILNVSKITIGFSLGIAFILIFLKIDLGFLGYMGNIDYFLISIPVLYLLLFIQRYNGKIRVIFYILFLFSLSLIFYNSKREAIFFILPILLLESKFFYRLDFNKILILIFGAFVLLFLIIIMSIMRGYGDYTESKNFFKVVPFVLNYIGDETFLKYLFNNIEVNYFFFHSYQSLEYVFKDSGILVFGESYIKPLFIMFPRNLFPNKPESIIHLYTVHHDPLYRKIAHGSYPINIIAESFFNFHFLGIPALLIILTIISILFKKILVSSNQLKFIIGLFFYMNLLTFFRGSGIDMFLIYLILFSFFLISQKIILNKIIKKNN